MDNMHFFMFSNGEYSDYSVRGMYVCDHIVDEEEWEQFAKDKSAQRQKAREDSILKYCARTGDGVKGWYRSDEYKEYQKYCDENCVKDLFIKVHGMREIFYTELWEY
jgi:hypothetical protein